MQVKKQTHTQTNRLMNIQLGTWTTWMCNASDT